MIHIKDRKREFESALIGKRRKCIETFLELEPVIAARECVPHRLFLRLAQLLRELRILAGEFCVTQHLLAHEEEDERQGRIDGKYRRCEHDRRLMVLPMIGVDAAEDDERDERQRGVAARRVMLPARADHGVDEYEEPDEQNRIIDVEEIRIAAQTDNLGQR